jgi:hypothetical protein
VNCYIIEEFVTREKVTFYTFRHEDSELSETDKFFERFQGTSAIANDKKYLEDFNDIVALIDEIGRKGAFKKYFRDEGKVEALPSEFRKYIGDKLRLFCIRLSDSIVILGNGGIKSSLKTQNSPDLSTKFYLMGTIADAINQLLQRKEWVLKYKNIEPKDNLEICL